MCRVDTWATMYLNGPSNCLYHLKKCGFILRFSSALFWLSIVFILYALTNCPHCKQQCFLFKTSINVKSLLEAHKILLFMFFFQKRVHRVDSTPHVIELKVFLFSRDHAWNSLDRKKETLLLIYF